jgi:hypothetical protein
MHKQGVAREANPRPVRFRKSFALHQRCGRGDVEEMLAINKITEGSSRTVRASSRSRFLGILRGKKFEDPLIFSGQSG